MDGSRVAVKCVGLERRLLLRSARAALSLDSSLGVETDLVSNLDKGGHVLIGWQIAVVLDVSGGSQLDGGSHVVELVAAAALWLGAASGGGTGVANEVALGLGARRRLLAGPGALGSRASGSAVGNSRGADSLALSRQANVLAQRAAARLAVLSRATNLTLGLLATDVAGSLTELLAAELAGGLLALRLTNGGTRWGIAVPLAIREAVALHSEANLLEASSIGESHFLGSCSSDQQGANKQEGLHLFW